MKLPGLGEPHACVVLVGETVDGSFQPEMVEVRDSAAAVLATVGTPQGIRIPTWAIDETNDPPELSPAKAKAHLNTLAGAQLERTRAALLDGLRRLESIHVSWTESQRFFGAPLNADAQGEAKFFLSEWLVAGTAETVRAEFTLRGHGKIAGNAAQLSATFALTVAVCVNEVPQLRLAYDDFNFSFPEIAFPSLDLKNSFRVEMPDGAGASRLLQRLGALAQGVATVKCTDPHPPMLVVDASAGELNFALVKPDQAPVNWNDLPSLATQLASFEITFNGVTEKQASISGVQLAFARGQFVAQGIASASVELFNEAVEEKRLGAFAYRVEKLQIMLGGRAGNAHDMAVVAQATFTGLRIWVADDPAAVLAFDAKVDLTPSGARLLELKLREVGLQRVSLPLVQAGAEALQRAARSIATLAAQFKGIDASVIRSLFEILGRFAAAVARQSYVVGQAITGAAEEAGRAIAAMLDGIGEGIKSLLQMLAELAPDGGAPSDLEVQVTVSLDPIEILQILVLHRSIGVDDKKLAAAGLELKFDKEWRPGVLVDLGANPGAYFVVAREALDTDVPDIIATLGTDLWLKSEPEKTVSHAPDADSQTGDRAKGAKLIEVTVKRNEPKKRMLAVIAGVSQGRSVFLKRLIMAEGSVIVADGTAAMQDLGSALRASVKVQTQRLLPLLGMGETGEKPSGAGNGGGFLKKLQDGMGQVVWVEDLDGDNLEVQATDSDVFVTAKLKLGVKAAGISSIVDVDLQLSLKTLHATLKGPSGLGLKSARIEEEALGLTWVVEQTDETARKNNIEVSMFKLAFSDGESGFELDTAHARMELRFGGLSSDGEGIVFKVTTFRVGRRGVDITAEVDRKSVRLNGLNVPFQFTSGSFRMRASRLIEASVTGSGALPPDLVGEATCSLALAFAQGRNGIELQSGKVEIDKKGEPIVCHSTRFTLTISDLDVGIQKDAGAYHFYFLVTGSLRFTPKDGEFESGLLGFLKDIEINLERAPLTGDARVLGKHISFQKALNPKKTFNLFNLFTFELRGFGFHPASPRFGGKPAINLSGQIKFAEIGDVMQPSIDFHGLWIAPPADGEALPRISAEGLGLDLQLSGSVKIRGSVLAVDPSTRTVEGKESAPAGYNTYGFLGEGEVEIPGWGCMQASLGFLEIEKKSTGERKKAFFVYLQKDQMAVQIPTGFWTFYMREAGFGFGFRYTLAGIRDADTATSPAHLIRVLDDVSKRQGDLARYAAWSPDPEGDRFTLALRAAIQAYPAEQTYNAETEATAANPFFFDVIVALRSDLTLLASMRGYLGVNYADFRANKNNLRERPGLRGYLYISAPRSELLARMIADSKGFIGERFPGLQTGQILRRAVESVDWSSTLYIRPGLFHYEMGWPDQLSVRLVDTNSMKVSLRGGMIFRAAEDGLLWGYNIEADAWLRFGGSVGSDIGVAVEASMQARFIARLIAYLSWRLQGSLVYGLVSLDATLAFSVRAWMKVNLRFTSFTIRIGFTFSVHFSAAIEMAIGTDGVGARAQARVSVNAFGCTLGVFVGFSFNDGALESARARVQRFMAMSITADEPTEAPKGGAKGADDRTDEAAARKDQVAAVPPAQAVEPTIDPGTQNPSIVYPPEAGRDIGATDFWMAMHVDARDKDVAYALLVPMEARQEDRGGFYSAPIRFGDDLPPSHVLQVGDLSDDLLKRIELVDADGNLRRLCRGVNPVHAKWLAKVPVEEGADPCTLGELVDQCFITNVEWVEDAAGKLVRRSYGWREPSEWRVSQSRHERPAGSEQERNLNRDALQKDQAATAASRPADERAYQGRSTVMTMFLDQFVTFAAQSMRPSEDAHVLDLGLMLRGPADALEALANVLTVEKADAHGKPGEVKVLNPAETWFVKQDPIFAAARSEVGPTGPRLAWDLSFPWMRTPSGAGVAGPDDVDPDNFLLQYEIVRTVEGREFTPHVRRVKPASTMGGAQGEEGKEGKEDKEGGPKIVRLLKPDWQFTDDLADLGDNWRHALLPPRNEQEAMQAAGAWITLGLNADVTITYSITPLDIAGTRGLPRSFALTVDRPRPAIRPAQAELRILQDIGAMQAQKTRDQPKDLQVFIGLKDAAWEKDQELPIGGAAFSVRREYRLYVEHENVLPSGSFGSDGLTDRLRGFGGDRAIAQAIDRAVAEGRGTFLFGLAGMVDVASAVNPAFTSFIKAYVEEDDEARAKLPMWAVMSGQPVAGVKPVAATLPQALWLQDFRQVACRFWLRAELAFYEVVDGKPKAVAAHRLASMPVEVPVSLSMRNQVRQGPHAGVLKTLAVVQPQAFEWPVDLQLPPLPLGQVRVQTGFLHMMAPQAQATLSEWVQGKAQDALTMLRDPARRTLSVLEFDAMPVLGAADVDPVFLTSIAGYDVHSLDLDDLAPADSQPGDLETDVRAWKRARRVAHVKLLSPDAASLTPPTNSDWLGWHASYPSETWRTPRPGEPGNGEGAIPIRKGWYSARESLPRFAERLPRQRLLPHAVDSFVDELLLLGLPTRIKAWLAPASDSRAAQTLGGTGSTLPVQARTLATGAGETPAPWVLEGDVFRIAPEAGKAPPKFTAARLRYLLLCLCRPDFVGDRMAQVLALWQQDVKALDGLNLMVEAQAAIDKDGRQEIVRLASVTIPVQFGGPMHGILEETIGELAWEERDDGHDKHGFPILYRRYAVSVQAPPAVEGAEFGKYLASTAAAADPYGWGALQGLGLAVTLRLFDLSAAQYEKPQTLARHADRVFSHVIGRWVEEGMRRDVSADAVAGQPFAEVLLRPGANRVARPFDGLALRAEQAYDVNANDRALAMVQLSLRPAPHLAWQYATVTLEPMVLQPDGGRPARIRQLMLEVVSEREDEVLDAAIAGQTAVTRLEGKGKACLLPVVIHAGPQRRAHDEVPRITVMFRRRRGEHGVNGLALTYVATLEVPVIDPAAGQPVEIVQQRAAATFTASPVAIDRPGQTLPQGVTDPFGAFDPQPADQWAFEAAAGSPAMQSLQRNLQAVVPGFAFPGALEGWKAVMPQYLEWMHRMTDHARAPQAAGPDGKVRISLAIAAPSRVSPCELAPDSTGCVTVTIPGDDRLAHAKAYAVRPVSRYANVLAGAGHGTLQDSEQLVDPVAGAAPPTRVGYAVSVVPRTERIEPPVILGSRVNDDGNWELVIGRHAEESMAHSNRPLFARLGKPSTLVSQLRTYRTPQWPERVRCRYPAAGDFELYPERLAAGPAGRPAWEAPDAMASPGALVRLSEGRLALLAAKHTGLWKGAEVLSFTAPPPQYRMAALAVARAGIVLSNISTVIQDDFRRRDMDIVGKGDGGHKGPVLWVERKGREPATLVLRHRLVSHHDLTPDDARQWETGGRDDIAWWPDPDVIYNVVHRRTGAGLRIDEELLEIRLVPQAPDGDKTLDAGPVVVRARGNRWKPHEDEDAVGILRTPAWDRSLFELALRCEFDPAGPSGPAVTMKLIASHIEHAQFPSLVQHCEPFAAYLLPYSRSYTLVRGAESPDAYVDRVAALLAGLREQIEIARRADGLYPAQALADEMTALADALQAWFAAHAGSADIAAELEKTTQAGGAFEKYMAPLAVLRPATGHDIGTGLMRLDVETGKDGIVVIRDVPTAQECEALAQQPHPLALKDSQLWQLLAQRLKGGADQLMLRAVDARGQIPTPSDAPEAVATNHSVGWLEIEWPSYVTAMVS
ncbi:hypothetical protein J2W28_004470 [Variovorax boronicumulans]|uniref:hypothetical protein n=1 Tax=Variovorax boronicumulans TaxID=436515 RepID=UPI0027834992|nr:hypothetical protein [Variovorax boronicumulans]MDP9993827.1 hypothetical protein [Variovorax boronicumulans]MDQ0005308.1 hypothetical protein [Variovorax boronicumulans]